VWVFWVSCKREVARICGETVKECGERGEWMGGPYNKKGIKRVLVWEG
jgi:hypothetical protein